MPTDAEGLPPEFYGKPSKQDTCSHPTVRRVKDTWHLPLAASTAPNQVRLGVYCECLACGKGWWE